ncbi:uncharacterized protein ISCGN_026430 [Ixodes scapularis]
MACLACPTVPLRMFWHFLDSGSVPTAWKLSHVTPILKATHLPSDNPDSYRPVASTSVACRTLERVINKQLLVHLESSALLSPAQHGFRQGRSCETALASLVHTASAHLDSHTPCEIVQMDLSKAFDRINHHLLLRKLRRVGVDGCLLSWLSSSVTGRFQSVGFAGPHSDPWLVASGVPQGSVLGPTLFIIFIDDITTSLSSTPFLYADDLALLHPIKTPVSYTSLQSDLDHCYRWSLENLLPFNISKCCSMTVTSQRPSSAQSQSLCLGGVPLQQVTNLRILGESVDSRLHFGEHITLTTTRARRLLGFVVRVTRGMSPAAFRHLYTALVLPILDCSKVWHPHQSSLQSSLEAVQRRAGYIYVRRTDPATEFTYRGTTQAALYQTSRWCSLLHRRQLASIRLFCLLMQPSYSDIPDRPRLNLRTGAVQPVLARTLRHRESCLLRAASVWRGLPSSMTHSLPSNREDIRALQSEAARYV